MRKSYKAYKHEWYMKNKERISAEGKVRYLHNKARCKKASLTYATANKDKVEAYKKEWCVKNREKIAAQRKAYYLKNREKIRQKAQEHYLKHKDHHAAVSREYYQNNRAAIVEKSKVYVANHREAVNKRLRAYHLRKRANDPIFRLTHNIKSAVWLSLKKNKGGKSWESLVGYSLQELKERLETMFDPVMSWDNYGDWHVDHIRPVCSFNIVSSNCHDFQTCWALDNLRPLWAKDNLVKSAADKKLRHKPTTTKQTTKLL